VITDVISAATVFGLCAAVPVRTSIFYYVQKSIDLASYALKNQCIIATYWYPTVCT
jgi:hypothetical protein